eukprot:5630836-Alexandrium_andersonii.AAC.1
MLSGLPPGTAASGGCQERLRRDLPRFSRRTAGPQDCHRLGHHRRGHDPREGDHPPSRGSWPRR